MATLDLKDAYFLIPINNNHKKFLRFKFHGTIYQFNCMPFGLSCAPWVFTKLMKPVLYILRGRGLISVLYLDDFLLLGNTMQECENNVSQTISLLKSLGFIINFEKSVPKPSQQCKYLGFVYNSNLMAISLPQKKRENILKLTNKFLALRSCKIRSFARYIGILASACPAVCYGWLYTKALERQKFLALKSSKGNYEASMKISANLKEDLLWWLNNISNTNNFIKPPKFEIEIFSDASTTGWGIYCNGKVSRGLWSESEKQQHINFLELLAAFFGLKCFASEFSNCHILLRIDNTTAIAYINRMGSIQHPLLNNLSRKIWQWCEHRKIVIFASYIKSVHNTEADRESRNLDVETEWSLNDAYFEKIILYFGKPVIDLFASRHNTKCGRFVSWKRDPDAWAVDAFTLSWKIFFFYAFPPFSLILRILQKIIEDKAEGILVVPLWPAQAWFPLFNSLLIEEPLYFPPSRDSLLSANRIPHPLWPSLTLVAGVLSGGRYHKGKSQKHL